MKERYSKLLHLLQSSSGKYMRGGEISQKLHVTERTVRNDIKDLNENFLVHAEIVSNKRYGYKLVGQLDTNVGKNYPEYEDRAFFIVRKLIETEEWITYEQVAAELHFSHQTIRSDVQKIAHLIARRNIDLKLETVIFHGIRLTGSEWSKRMLWHEMARLQCTSSEEGKFLIHKYFDSNDSMPGLYEDVQHLIRKENALATPEQVTSTVAHLFILCKRDGEKCKLELVIPLESKEYVLAKKLLEKTIKSKFVCKFPQLDCAT